MAPVTCENNQPWCKHGGCELEKLPQLGSVTGGQVVAKPCRAWAAGLGRPGWGAGAEMRGEQWVSGVLSQDLFTFLKVTESQRDVGGLYLSTLTL